MRKIISNGTDYVRPISRELIGVFEHLFSLDINPGEILTLGWSKFCIPLFKYEMIFE
jgi:hypothetical protein